MLFLNEPFRRCQSRAHPQRQSNTFRSRIKQRNFFSTRLPFVCLVRFISSQLNEPICVRFSSFCTLIYIYTHFQREKEIRHARYTVFRRTVFTFERNKASGNKMLPNIFFCRNASGILIRMFLNYKYAHPTVSSIALGV